MVTKEFNVVVASDNNYAGQVSVLLASILDHLQQGERLVLHLLANGIDDAKLRYLRQQMGQRGSLQVYDTSNIAQRLGVEVPATIAITAYARLFVDRLLPATVGTVLYLDCDIVVNRPIAPLMATDLSQVAMAGVLDTLPNTEAKTKVGLAPTDPYYNSGMLLINLDCWRRVGMSAKFLDFLLAHNGKVHHHDQGIINGVLAGQILTLPPEYNLTSNYFSHQYDYVARRNNPFYTRQQVEHAIQHPVVIHYTEGFLDRPWVATSKHPLRATYLHYRSQSMLAGEPLQRSRKTWYVKLLGWEFMHLPLPFYNATSWLLGQVARFRPRK